MTLKASQGNATSSAEIDADLLEKSTHGPRFYSVPVPHLTLVRSFPAIPTSRWSVSTGKRLMDIVGALIALFMLSPIFLFVALLVAMTSEGSVLFQQRRVGRYGQLFTIYKFRTMRQGAGHPASAITQCGDPRITPIGCLLRRFKIDEMPQFYNVLRGDMSLVGPRPKLAQHEAGMHMPFRPGITGAATLAFRCEEEMLRHVPHADLESYCARTIKPIKTSIDSEYMRNASIFSDLSILMRTAASCSLPRRYHPILRLNSPDLGSFDLERLDLTLSDPC
jgi:lipopolysaccharide/colanic/teichoic acid biosynthesis glycosyltransferase